jgi:molybdate-binding protein/DNA-binding transcriptional regulator YhcF (GntR family)
MTQPSPMYQQIAEDLRRRIAVGEYSSGQHLPSVRKLAASWHCTPGTAARAYGLLRQDGLVVGRGAQGTRVADSRPFLPPAGYGWASLVNRSERLLLEALAEGYASHHVASALAMAIARWEAIHPAPPASIGQGQTPATPLRFVGSHDLVIDLISRSLASKVGLQLQAEYTGSLGGLVALSQGTADLAGLHLWDEATDSYNLPFIRRMLPGMPLAVISLAFRQIGLIVPTGNPQGLRVLSDLFQPEVSFVNRQPGSGTRIWLEAQLRRLGLDPADILGYQDAAATHLDAAAAVAAGRATVALGLHAAAASFNLDFIPLHQERYDLVMLQSLYHSPSGLLLRELLNSAAVREAFHLLGGYGDQITGQEQPL